MENDCHVNATCTNTDGSYNCSCRNGTSGDGYNSCEGTGITFVLHDCLCKVDIKAPVISLFPTFSSLIFLGFFFYKMSTNVWWVDSAMSTQHATTRMRRTVVNARKVLQETGLTVQVRNVKQDFGVS